MTRPFSISIRTLLIVGFAGVTATGIGIALFVGLSTAFQNTSALLSDKAETGVARIVDAIETRLEPVALQGKWIGRQVANGRLDVRRGSASALGAAFGAAVAATPQVAGIAVIDSSGIARQWGRDGTALAPEDWSSRPGMMDWLTAGSAGPAPAWGPPIWVEALGSATIVHETPLFDADGYVGYLALAVGISDLSRQIHRLSEHAFVLAGRSEVLAHPMMIGWRPLDRDEVPSAASIYAGRSALAPLAELGDRVLERIWTTDHRNLTMLRAARDVEAVAVDIGSRQFVILHRQLSNYGPKPWFVGAYFDVSTVGDFGARLKSAVGAGATVFAIAVVISLLVGRALGRPIAALAQAARVVRREQFDELPALPASRIAELREATDSFREMTRGLAERAHIRRTLGRYVPQQVAEMLLSGDGALAPAEGVATILFADIAGFTTLTESLGPGRIVEVLNAYFSRMTEIIEARGGVITQFQGDAILAIFNVPIAAEDHAAEACRAALEMRTCVNEETFAGEHLRSRIGVNTGPIVAGAVGAEGRLSYTVHGDAVNRAARLEAMNKDTGTSILLSETTVKAAVGLAARQVGESSVRGQQGKIALYTLDG